MHTVLHHMPSPTQACWLVHCTQPSQQLSHDRHHGIHHPHFHAADCRCCAHPTPPHPTPPHPTPPHPTPPSHPAPQLAARTITHHPPINTKAPHSPLTAHPPHPQEQSDGYYEDEEDDFDDGDVRERVFLVGVALKGQRQRFGYSIEESLEELGRLADTAGLRVGGWIGDCGCAAEQGCMLCNGPMAL
jgi:hypothetical protein